DEYTHFPTKWRTQRDKAVRLRASISSGSLVGPTRTRLRNALREPQDPHIDAQSNTWKTVALLAARQLRKITLPSFQGEEAVCSLTDALVLDEDAGRSPGYVSLAREGMENGQDLTAITLLSVGLCMPSTIRPPGAEVTSWISLAVSAPLADLAIDRKG
ncbi:hypothetical protein FRB97_003615, partial [Tulasnella sp. 331]